MNERETFHFEGMDVTVEETAGALTYTFRARERVARPVFPFGFVFLLVLLPVGLLALLGSAYAKNPNRPDWELVLTGMFALQVLVWLVVGTGVLVRMIRWWYGPSRSVLRFTRTHLWHAGAEVCALEDVRGLRLFVYPATDEPGQTDASLSFVIGAEGGTHGLFGGFSRDGLGALADGLHHRLVAFRLNQGMMSALDPVSVVETTEVEAEKLIHTLPAKPGFRPFAAAITLLLNRPAGTVWCVLMIAGLIASGRFILAAGLSSAYLCLHGLLGLLHLMLLRKLWEGSAQNEAPDGGATG